MNQNPASTRPAYLDDPHAFEGVLSRRVLASVIDLGSIILLVMVLGTLFTVLTLGLGLLLIWALPFTALIAIAYVAMTVGSPAQATWGMRLMGVRMERTDGGRVDALLAAIHALVYWGSVTIATPLVLLIGLFTDRRRLLHDIVLGIVVVRSDTQLR